MAKVTITPAPNLTGTPSPQFRLNEFEAAVHKLGYEVILENALRCPCGSSGSALVDCQNCLGTGYFYVSPVKTRGLITNLNKETKFKPWSQELLGTIQISINEINKPNLGYYDRITIEKEYAFYSENLHIRRFDMDTFVFTTYRPVVITSIHLFVSSTEKLIKLSPLDYSVSKENPYCIIFHTEIPDNFIASVYYKHQPELHVIDLPHVIRSSWTANKDTGAQDRIRLPLQAIARLSHLIASGKPNFDGTGLIDNG